MDPDLSGNSLLMQEKNTLKKWINVKIKPNNKKVNNIKDFLFLICGRGLLLFTVECGMSVLILSCNYSSRVTTC